MLDNNKGWTLFINTYRVIIGNKVTLFAGVTWELWDIIEKPTGSRLWENHEQDLSREGPRARDVLG